MRTTVLSLLTAAALVAVVGAQQGPRRQVISPDDVERPYSPGVRVGKTLYISGQLGDATPDLRAGTRQAMERVGAVLKAAGLGYEHLVTCHVYLADMDDYVAMNETYRSFFGDRVPSRTTVQATALPANAGVEITCIAYTDLDGISVVQPPAGALPRPLGPYSPAVWAGDTLYLSGMGGELPADRSLPPTLEAQIAQTLTNIGTTLEAAGLGPKDVVSTSAYATTEAARAQTGPALVRHFGAGTVPPYTLVPLPRLPGQIQVELTFVAAKPSQGRSILAGGAGGASLGIKAGQTAYLSPLSASSAGPTIEAQAKAAFGQFVSAMRGLNITPQDIASVQVHLADIGDLPVVNAIFRERFPKDPPARTTIQASLPAGERIRVGGIGAQ